VKYKHTLLNKQRDNNEHKKMQSGLTNLMPLNKMVH